MRCQVICAVVLAPAPPNGAGAGAGSASPRRPGLDRGLLGAIAGSHRLQAPTQTLDWCTSSEKRARECATSGRPVNDAPPCTGAKDSHAQCEAYLLKHCTSCGGSEGPAGDPPASTEHPHPHPLGGPASPGSASPRRPGLDRGLLGAIAGSHRLQAPTQTLDWCTSSEKRAHECATSGRPVNDAPLCTGITGSHAQCEAYLLKHFTSWGGAEGPAGDPPASTGSPAPPPPPLPPPPLHYSVERGGSKGPVGGPRTLGLRGGLLAEIGGLRRLQAPTQTVEGCMTSKGNMRACVDSRRAVEGAPPCTGAADSHAQCETYLVKRYKKETANAFEAAIAQRANPSSDTDDPSDEGEWA
jgi:hypothetical protein